jgi:hypothetical protein
MIQTFAIVGSGSNENVSCLPISKYLCNAGFYETTPSAADFLVSLNHNSKVFKQFRAQTGKSLKAFLIRLEPPTVFPAQYNSKISNLYDKVFTPGSEVGDLPWPYEYHPNPSSPLPTVQDLSEVIGKLESVGTYDVARWKDRYDKAVLVAANKVSPINDGNYALRRSVAKFSNPYLLDIYGALWNASIYTRLQHRFGVLLACIKSGGRPRFKAIHGELFRRYPMVKGYIDDKHKLSQRYRFALVIENDTSYISEKLIDALIDGCIPFYFGRALPAFGISQEFVIPFSTISNLENTITNFSDLEAAKYLSAAKSYLLSPEFSEMWDSNRVYTKMAQTIVSILKGA